MVPYVKGKVLASDGQKAPNSDRSKNRIPNDQRTVELMVAMPPITEDYPVISKNNWSVRVYGKVKNEITYSFMDLENLERRILWSTSTA